METAKDKIMAMCCLARLGEMMKRLAVKIRKLLQATIKLSQSANVRLKTFIDSSADSGGGALGSLSDSRKTASDLANQGMKMFKMLGVTSS